MQNEQATSRPYNNPIRWLHMSFTEESLQSIRDYRRKIAHDTGKHLAMGQALDALIKSHPFVNPSE